MKDYDMNAMPCNHRDFGGLVKIMGGLILVLLATETGVVFADSAKAADGGQVVIKAVNIKEKLDQIRRPEIFDPRPPIQPRQLEANQSDAVLKVPARNRMDTYEEFRAELDRLREWARPFQRDFTPAIPVHRPRLDLKQFKFRLETPEDVSDPQRPWREEGPWKEVTVPDYRGPAGAWAGYYRASLALPADFAAEGRRVVLHFEGVDYQAQVWLNGGFLGQHTGYFGAFEFDATDRLKPGTNILLLRVENKPPPSMGVGGSKIDGMCQPYWERPTAHSSAAGLWRPVWLEARKPIHISQVFVRPQKGLERGEVWIEVQNLSPKHEDVEVVLDFFPRNFEGGAVTGIRTTRINNPINSAQAGAETVNPAIPQQVDEVIFRVLPGINTFKLPIETRGLRTWSPEHPWLYTARASLVDAKGRISDAADSAFGWRFLEFDETSTPYKGWPTLNGEKIFLRGTGEWSNFEVDLLKGNPAQILEDMLIFKVAHNNFMRFTMRGAAPREVYELADQLGLMIQADMPAHGRIRNETAAEYVRQAGEMAHQIRPHASATMVSYMNEQRSDVALALSGAWASYLHVDEINLLMKQCDLAVKLQAPDMASRWIEGVNASSYVRHGDVPEGIQDVHYYNFWFWPRYSCELLAGTLMWPKEGWLMSVGEYGAEALDDWQSVQETWAPEYRPPGLDAPWDYTTSQLKSALERLYPLCFDHQETPRGWIESSQDYQSWVIRSMQEAFRRRADRIVLTGPHYMIDGHPPALGYSLVTYARRPKKAYYEFADCSTPLAVNLYLPKTRYESGSPLICEFWLLNDTGKMPEGARLAWQILVSDKVLFQASTAAKSEPLKAIYQGSCHWITPPVKQRTTFKLRLALLSVAGEVLHDQIVPFEVFPPLEPVTPSVLVYQVGGLLDQKLMRELGLKAVTWDEAAVIVVSDRKAFEAQSREISERVRQGAGLLLLNPRDLAQENPPDASPWKLGELTIARQGTTTRHFVSRKTGHPVVSAYQPSDFRNWYYPSRTNMYQLFATGYDPQEGGKPILVTYQDSKGVARKAVDVAVEYYLGRGRVIACALNFEAGTLEDNPIARSFMQRMISYVARQ